MQIIRASFFVFVPEVKRIANKSRSQERWKLEFIILPFRAATKVKLTLLFDSSSQEIFFDTLLVNLSSLIIRKH